MHSKQAILLCYNLTIYSGTMTPSCEPFSEKLIRFPPTNLFTIAFFYIIINIAQQT
jgi:hypothetical protein